MSAGLSGQLSDEEKMRGTLYTSSGQLTQNLWLCYYCVRLCAQRWIGSAFRATKSLGMHTEAGSGNSNTALSWAVKEDNMSCLLWTGLVNTQIHIFYRETLPASHFTERAFLFCLFIFSQNGLLVWALLAPVGISHHKCSSIKSYAFLVATYNTHTSLYTPITITLFLIWMLLNANFDFIQSFSFDICIVFMKVVENRFSQSKGLISLASDVKHQSKISLRCLAWFWPGDCRDQSTRFTLFS